jgi:hypothetical protein
MQLQTLWTPLHCYLWTLPSWKLWQSKQHYKGWYKRKGLGQHDTQNWTHFEFMTYLELNLRRKVLWHGNSELLNGMNVISYWFTNLVISKLFLMCSLPTKTWEKTQSLCHLSGAFQSYDNWEVCRLLWTLYWILALGNEPVTLWTNCVPYPSKPRDRHQDH